MTSTISSYQLSTQVNGETKRFTLVDTPGFDDGERTDDDVFHDLAKWLRISYQKNQRFHGML